MSNRVEFPSWTAYLFLFRNHAVPIWDVQPDEIKAGAKHLISGGNEQILHTQVLNAVAKHLGMPGGFPGYRKSWPQLDAFLRDHGMRHRADLIGRAQSDAPRAWFSRRAIADRFFIGDSLPKRIFTGAGFDWARLTQLHDVGVWDVQACFNLLSDAMVQPASDRSPVLRIYQTNTVSPDWRVELEREARARFAKFQRLMDAGQDGWVDVLRYNEALIFLRGAGGTYDFVFRGLRDQPPPPLPFDGHLNWCDVPTECITHHCIRARQLYFSCDVWDERDRHAAEQLFYEHGGTAFTYPGEDEILWDLLHDTKRVSVVMPVRRVATLDGYRTAQLADGKRLGVSDLIRIAQFQQFAEESGYRRRRLVGESLERANQDPPDAPACATYYDALAYARWVEERTGAPTRLLSIAEYRELHPGAEPDLPGPPAASLEQRRLLHGCVRFVRPDGSERAEWGWINDDEQAWFKAPLDRRRGRGGIEFVVAYSFGEWLFEHSGHVAAAIHTWNLTGIHDGDPIERDWFPCDSWGLYRCAKIGFRVCYEI
jgi:Sulfatase-modifying factor enzyme 1